MDPWSCCMCKTWYLIATVPVCPVCDHRQCGDCRGGPLPSIFPLQHHRASHSYDTRTTANTTRFPPTRGPTHSSENSVQGSQYALQRRPSGISEGSDGHLHVWNCCQCTTSNLIATVPACPVCDHRRCGSCRDLGSPSPLFPSQHHRSGHSYYTPSPPSNQTHYRFVSPTFFTPPSAPPRHASLGTSAKTRPSSTQDPSYDSYDSIQGSQYALQQWPRGARGGPESHNSQVYAPQPMTGWWKCCHDGHINNSIPTPYTPDRCPQDNHKRCGYCHVLS